jgi:hypothetical protein
MYKSAEQVVRKVIIEVHGPFFNAEVSRMHSSSAQMSLLEAWELLPRPAEQSGCGKHCQHDECTRCTHCHLLRVSCCAVLLQILDKELTHLEKAACHLDPAAQRVEAATVKLLASALLQVGA